MPVAGRGYLILLESKIMRPISLSLIVVFFLAACKKDNTTPGQTTPPPAVSGLLKDIIYSSLPSPYYHFDYNNGGKVSSINFSDGLAVYSVAYSNNTISEINKTNPPNHDQLSYTYESGKPVVVLIKDNNKVVYKRCFLEYDVTGKLSKMNWEVKSSTVGFQQLKEISFTYYTDGNLEKMITHLFPIDGVQTDVSYTDKYEDYDTKKNTDDFTLFQSFTEHTMLLPGVVLQKNNARKITHTSDSLSYTVDYTYTYNTSDLPVFKNGMLHITGGTDAGKNFTITTQLIYYP